MVKQQMQNKAEYKIAIIGGGFGGLGAAIRLLEQGERNFILFERAEEVGGTWRDNIYPGCACDVPSNLYSFSFEQNPSWSRLFPRQPEILDYLKHCVDKYDLKEFIQYNTAVDRLVFNEEEGYWQIEDQNGKQYSARMIVAATGPLNRPNYPKIDGLKSFAGPMFHSSHWDYSVDLKDKRVAVIGTGASAIQFVPEIAKEVKQLYVFQRTAPWIVPRPDKEVSTAMKQRFKHYPFLQNLVRTLIYWTFELRVFGFLGNKGIRRFMTRRSLDHLEALIPHDELRAKLTPKFEIGCKRVLVSDDYYPALMQDNVDLVTEAITSVSENCIHTADGQERPIDVLILGTGFQAAEYNIEIAVKGLQGQNLNEQWAGTGPQAYSGTTVSGFPNLLFLVGPNTGLGHNSIVHIIESQLNYVLDYLRILENSAPSAYLDVKPEAQEEFNADIQKKLANTVWQIGGCKSWYQMDSGKNTTLWPGSTVKFRKMTRKVKLQDYQLIANHETVDA
jgi:cation diffusion facilitator CzcD-associated flavoprotein CzcO